MRALLVVVVVMTCLAWGLVVLARLRRRRFLVANRPQVIKESLERARAKQQVRDDPPGRHRSDEP